MDSIHKEIFRRRFSLKTITTVIVFIIAPFFNTKAQVAIPHAVEANIIYHFTKYIDWPSGRKSGDFVIGVAGDPSLLEELKKATINKTIGNQKIVIRSIEASQSSFDCHILFVGEEESGNLKKIISKTRSMPVLVVCAEEGMIRRGACINFAVMNQKLTLEININNIERKRLRIASELLKLCRIVEE